MKKLIKISLLAIFLGIHPVSCNRYKDDCGSGKNHAFFISDVNIETKNIPNLGRGTHVYFAALIDTANSYHIDSIGFLMNFDHVDLASSNTISPFLGFQNIAIACSYSIKYQNPIENISAIYTGESINFNDSLRLNTGDTITGMFNISSTFSNYLNPEPLQSYNDPYQDMEESFLISFSEKNRDSLDFHFDLFTTLIDGNIFISKDLAVKLIPSI